MNAVADCPTASQMPGASWAHQMTNATVGLLRQKAEVHSVKGLIFFWQRKDLIGPNVEIYGLNKNKAQV